LFANFDLLAQGGPRGGQMPTTGRVYGKIKAAETNESLEFVVLQIFEAGLDASSRKLLGGGLTASNGDFSIDQVPLDKPLEMHTNLVGFEVSITPFKLVPGKTEKDLGNILLIANTILNEIKSMGAIRATVSSLTNAYLT
jgi:hypothetical protein